MRVLLAMMVVAAALAPTASATPTCRGGTTVKSTDRYRIYADAGFYFACLHSTGKVTDLYDVDDTLRFGEHRVAGRYVAVVADTCSSSGCDEWLVLADMRTGRSRTVTEEPAAWLALRATGSLAFYDTESASIELARWGRFGTRTLASGPGIEGRSLHREGTRAVWRKNGIERSARLP